MKASNPDHSFFISANAGSGKTKILIDRITALILAGANPKEILAITFTNNAAAEIKARIIKNIFNLLTLDQKEQKRSIKDLLGTDIQQSHLDNLAKIQSDILLGKTNFQIHTIHSFALELLKQFAFEAGLRPGFEVMSNIKAQKILADITNKIYANAELQENLNFLASILSLESLTEHLKLITEARTNILYLLFKAKTLDNQLKLLHNLLNLPELLPDIFELKKQFLLSNKLINLFKIIEQIKSDKVSKTDLKQFNLIKSLNFNDDLSIIKSFSRLQDFFCTKQGIKRSKFFTKATMGLADEFLELENLANEYLRLTELFARIDAFKINKSLMEIAVILLDQYQQHKQEHNLVDFEDILIKALMILSNNNNVNYVLTKYKHILVDEAQDTSKLQWEIIHFLYEDYLAGGIDKTLFIVGDEKQSIYGFQGARHELFKEKYEELANSFQNLNSGFHKIDLVKSYRTSQGLIDVVNLFCQHSKVKDALTQFDIELDHFANRQSEFMFKLLPFIENKRSKSDEYKLEFPIVPVTSNSNFVQQTDSIIHEIKYLVTNDIVLASTGANVRYQDVLILLPRRSQFFYDLYQALSDSGITVSIDGIKSIDDDIIFLDFKALIRFSYMPNDDYNLACLLKSPLIKFNDQQLEKIVSVRDSDKNYTSYYDVIKSGILPWTEDVKLILANIVKKSQFLAPYDFCLNIAYEYNLFLAYEQEFAGDSKLRLGHILSLINEFQECYGKSYHEVYVALIRHEKVIKNNISDNSVRLMTIHGSKGLEAPIVILADSNSKVTKNKEQLYFTDDNFLFTSGSGAFTEKSYILDEFHQRLENEFQRLNYVALTRAKDVLIIAGQGSSIVNSSLYDILVSELAIKHNISQDDISTNGFTITNLKCEKLLDQAVDEVLIPNEELLRDEVQKKDNYQTTLGTIIHNILDDLQFVKKEHRFDYIEKSLKDYDYLIAKEDIEFFKNNLMEIHEELKFSYIFNRNTLSEIEVIYKSQLYRIDKIIENDDSVEIIDFKTDLELPANNAQILPRYQNQLSIYEEALKPKYRDKKIIKKLFYLRHKKIITL